MENKIKKTLTHAYKRSYYPEHWKMDLEDAINLVRQGQYYKLPVIRKSDIRDHWDELIEYGDFTDIVSSSGTTGRPVDMPVHRLQEQVWIDSISRVLTELGAESGDRMLQLLSNNDMFTLGPLVWQASKKVGVGTFRCSPQRLSRVNSVIKYHKPNFVVGNPMVMLEMVETLGDDFPAKEDLPDYAYFGACSSFDANNQPTPVARKVMDLWGIKDALNEYGCSEVGSIGHECLSHTGFHINSDFVHVELIDTETGLPVPEGQPGEVVVTTLTQPRGFIAVRYATGDIAAWLDSKPCSCGRHGLRMGAIIGRVDHQLKIKGQTLFPDLVLGVTDKAPEVTDAVLVRYQDHLKAEQVELWLESTQDHQAVLDKVEAELISHVAVCPHIRMLGQGAIKGIKEQHMAKSNGVKIPRLIDIEDPNEYV
ncbi:AMP-binding protein [Vibrio sp. Of7-15]|uniref:phenylacetate--CoA ligase family protein n=1 Tax=Vibrio sp. Of7-15 TaxID=2724879 RepID=UPI001EF285B7|nr:AMP-binding protein [Vibrio sp. Of7-15]MCG7497357.1 AMP-binding protein [Vibrio sp. Of7-15]